MIKDIVVNLSYNNERDRAADYAISVAGEFGAHLSAVAFAYEPLPPPAPFGGVPVDLVAAQRAESERLATEAIARFDRAANQAGISADSRMVEATFAGAADTFARIARRYDLAILAQPEPEKAAPNEAIVHAALFESGRPIILVPYIQRRGMTLDHVIVCWDGGRAAARAIGDAVPLLERAKSVDVVIVATDRAKTDEIPGADMAQHLARHAAKVEVRRIVAPDVDVPNTILSHAADSGTDLIVMGGYGHSRLREFILGGATRGILGSMTVPVLMSH